MSYETQVILGWLTGPAIILIAGLICSLGDS